MGPVPCGSSPITCDVFAASTIGISVAKFMPVNLGAEGGSDLSRRPPIGDKVSCLTISSEREGVVLL